MTPKSGRIPLTVSLGPLLAAALLTGPAASATSATAAGPLPVAPEILPAEPETLTPESVSELGVVAGVAEGTTAPTRWVRLPGRGWAGRALALPDGATGGAAYAVNEVGEAAGGVLLADGSSRPVRWSVDGTRTTGLGPAGFASASGLRRWVVRVSADGITSTAEVVDRDGTRTPLTGTPELTGLSNVYDGSVAPDGTVLVTAVRYLGRASQLRPVLWDDGATVALPVFGSYFVGPACTSGLGPDGAVAYAGPLWDDAGNRYGIGVHTGGVPGENTPLAVPEGRTATVDCRSADFRAADGTVAATLEAGPGGSTGTQAVLWRRDGTRVAVPVRAGEQGHRAFGVASGGRVLLASFSDEGATTWQVARGDVRRTLSLPDGWNVDRWLGLTETGLAIAVASDADWRPRVVTWQT